MKKAQHFFITQSVAHARKMPMADAVVFLRGLLQSCDDDGTFVPVRTAFIALSQSDKQLELIAMAQLKSEDDNTTEAE